MLVGAAATALTLALMRASPHPWTLGMDNAGLFLGATTEVVRAWTSGRVPHWSDGFWGGFPLLGDSTSAAFYLPHLLPFALGGQVPIRALDWAFALHLGLFTAGTVRLLGLLGVAPRAALLGGALAMLCPFYHWSGIVAFPMMGALAWWPWAFGAAEELARPDAGARSMVQGWIALAAQVLVGVPEQAVYGATVTSLWLLTRQAGVPLLRRVLRLVALGTGAIALSAPQLLPTAAYVRETPRGGTPLAPGLASLYLTAPRALLLPAVGVMNSVPCFFGIATLALALVGAASRRPRALFLGALALGTFLLALGVQAPFYALLQRLPPFDRFRSPIKFQSLAEFGVVWLAGLGVDRLLRRSSRSAQGLALVLAAAALAERVAYVPQELEVYARLRDHDRDATVVLPALAHSRALVAAAPGEPPPLVLDAYGNPIDTFARNLTGLYGIASLTGGRVSLLSRRHEALLVPQPPGSSPASCRRRLDRASLDLFGVQRVMIGAPFCDGLNAALSLPVLERTDALCVLDNPSRPPRYVVLDRVAPVADEAAMLEAACTHPEAPVPVVAPPADLAARDDPAGGAVATVAYAAGRVALSVESARPALLLVRHSFVPGWEARVDDAPVPVYPAAGLYFAVPVPAGRHTVALRYRTPFLGAGLAIAALWSAGTVLWWRRPRLRSG